MESVGSYRKKNKPEQTLKKKKTTKIIKRKLNTGDPVFALCWISDDSFLFFANKFMFLVFAKINFLCSNWSLNNSNNNHQLSLSLCRLLQEFGLTPRSWSLTIGNSQYHIFHDFTMLNSFMLLVAIVSVSLACPSELLKQPYRSITIIYYMLPLHDEALWSRIITDNSQWLMAATVWQTWLSSYQ